MRGKPKAFWKDVLRVWEREIPKPDFAVHHAAKAVRLLPKVNFTGMPPKHPVLMNLLKRTKEFLEEDNCTMMVEDPEKPRGGRAHRIGLCTEDAQAMMRAATVLQRSIPELDRDIAPLLQVKVRDAVNAMSNKDVVRMLLIGNLKGAETWSRLLSRLGPELADDIDLEEVAPIIQLLCSQQPTIEATTALDQGTGQPVKTSPKVEGLRAEESGHLLVILRDQVVTYLDVMELRDAAAAIWWLGNSGLMNNQLQEAASTFILRRVMSMLPQQYDPSVWQIACSFAKVQREEPSLLKAVARLALKNDLGTMTNWAVAVMSWSYTQLERSQDGLSSFRNRLKAEAKLRGITQEQVEESPWLEYSEEMDKFWLAQRIDKRPLFIAPRPVKLLQKRSAKADAERAAEVGKLTSLPNWREVEFDDSDVAVAADLEEFHLFETREPEQVSD